MKEQTNKSVRLPCSLIEAAELAAEEQGLSFSDIVEAGLRKELRMKDNPRIGLLRDLSAWLQRRYPRKTGFPTDITREVFLQIHNDDGLYQSYDETLRNEQGQIDESNRSVIHRQIGQQVRRTLDAKVIGRSLEIENPTELIKTHALLVPQR